MGLILGRFRKKKTTLEQLEKIDTDIKSIETFRQDTEIAQKRIVGHFILFSAGIYILVAVVFYFYFFPATFYDQIFYITPLLLVPFILWGVKRLLTWYYRRKISRNETKLSSLRQEKKKLLEHVMDTETYKSAKIILEKFAPEQIKKTPVSSEVAPYRINNATMLTSTPLQPRTMLTSRNSLISVKTPMVNAIRNRAMSTPLVPQASTTNGRGQPQPGNALVARQTNFPGTPLPMPREILPRDRSVLDKMVEYLVGDGPGNRYALICKNCQSHNGMALREEFEYFAFRCCYCFTFNPARKLRPAAPKLEYDMTTPSPHSSGRRNSGNSTSSSERNSSTDTDGEEREKGGGEGSLSPSTAITEAAILQEPIIAMERPEEATPMEVDEEGEQQKTVEEKKNE